MPLKVRFRHAAAQRVLDLPDRGMAKPLIIGRGSDVDLRLPIEAVAPRHAALYVKDGAWMIQQMAGVVRLGGKAISGVAKLQSGDVVALGEGSSAPTLEIDPKLPIPPPSSKTESKALRSESVPAPAPARSQIRPAQPEPEPVAASPAPEEEPQYAAAEGDDTVGWDAQSAGADTSPFYVPKPKTPVIPLILVILLGGGALVAVGVYAYQKTRNPRVVVLTPDGRLAPAPPVTPANTKRPLFDLNPDQPPPKPAGTQKPIATPAASISPRVHADATTLPSPPPTSAPVAHVDRAPSVTEAPPVKVEAPPDPNDSEWNEIRSAHFNVRHQGVAIVKYDEYRLDHPGKFTALLDRYTDEAVNWLYWQRVAQLWARQDDLTAQIRQKKRDIQNQPPGAFHEQLVKELADLQARDEDTKKLLTDEMGYRGEVPPDLESPTELKRLEDSRDPKKYAAFAKHVLRYVRNNHGGVWWDGE